MNQKPYSSYHGRKSVFQRILIGVAILLAVVLLLAVVALFVFPATYAGDQVQFDLSWLPWVKSQQDTQIADEGPEPSVIVEEAGPSPSATDQADEPVKVEDLSFYVRRDVPRGLVPFEEGKTPAANQGVIFTSDQTAQLTREAAGEYSYAAVYLTAEEQGSDALAAQCLALADKGVDEIILAEVVPTDNGAALAKLYRDVKTALVDAGWEGRLSLVLEQSLVSGYDDDLFPAIAQSFNRLYFRHTMQNNVKNALNKNGFSTTAYTDTVTVYTAVPNVNYVWAVLPA